MGLLDFLKPDISALEERRDIVGLARALSYRSDTRLRQKAVWALVNALFHRADPVATKPLIKALSDPDREVRARAARALVYLPGAETTEALLKLVRRKGAAVATLTNGEEFPDVVAAARKTLEKFHDDEMRGLGLPQLAALARGGNPLMRREVVRLLREKDFSVEVARLARTLAMDADADIRDEAETLLRASVVHLRDRVILEEVAQSGNHQVRSLAQARLQELAKVLADEAEHARREAAKPEFVKALERVLRDSHNPQSARQAIAIAEGHIGEFEPELAGKLAELLHVALHGSHNKYFAFYSEWSALLPSVRQLVGRLASVPRYNAVLLAVAASAQSDADSYDAMTDDSAFQIAARQSAGAAAETIKSLLSR